MFIKILISIIYLEPFTKIKSKDICLRKYNKHHITYGKKAPSP